ncbi:MAG TPA: GNAT family protein [Anoxybacillus sp.]|jgi:[ribosomal protein S5]-alanine N-acetyltransferase|nr:GNAT family protein [Anoxybacillus sp.]
MTDILPVIHGKRVMLREFTEEDWTSVHAYASQEIACQYQPWGPNTEKDSQLYVKQIIEDTKKNPRTRFAFAVIKNDSNEMIGTGELNIHSLHHKNAEIAYIINPAFWGNGYATEVADLLIQFGFANLGLHRIFATCDPRNVASAKVLRKVGMTFEGTLRENLLIRDGWRDSSLFSVIRHEWLLSK